jgi:PAS domain S-box-containing protein
MSSCIRDLSAEGVCSRACDNLRQMRKPFGSLIFSSTVGVALFDENLCCRALSAALGRMMGTSAKATIGKSMQYVFPQSVECLEPVFRQVWNTGTGLPNVELAAQVASRGGKCLWSLNFYPVRDQFGELRLVAITFSDVTKRRCAELKLHHLKTKLETASAQDDNSPRGESVDLPARTFQLIERSLEILNSSATLRCHTVEMRIEADLGRLALFLCGTRYQEFLSQLPQSDSESPSEEPPIIHTPSSPETCGTSKLAASDPSPRERQLLYFLADGKSNKEIGSILAISTRTVEAYRARIMLKLDLHSTAALVRYAIRNHIVEP